LKHKTRVFEKSTQVLNKFIQADPRFGLM